jgi:hypothetical protein
MTGAGSPTGVLRSGSPPPRAGLSVGLASPGAIPRHGSLPCEDKHGRLVTSGDAVMVLPTLAFAAVVCRLLSTGCRAFAACSPPVDTACGIRDGTLSAVAVRPVHDYLHHWRASR